MRVLVYEPKFVGHFLGFAAATANAYARAGCEVTLATSRDAATSVPAEVKLAALAPEVATRFDCDVPKVYQKWTNARLETAALESLLDEGGFDWLAAPSADFLVAGLLLNRGLRRRVAKLSGADFVLHNCRQAYPRPALRERPELWLDRLTLNLLSGVRLHTVDEYAVSEAAAGRVAWWGSPVKSLPHFYDRQLGDIDRAAARERLGLDGGARWLGSVGDLGRRKGTELLIESFAAAGRAAEMRLALFGCLSPSVKETLAKRRELVDSGRIVVRDRFVSEQEFNDFFPAMDAVWAGYPRQVGMASTLLYAADAGRPVIAIDFGGVGWTVRKYALGVVCHGDRDSIVSQIRTLAKASPTTSHHEGTESFLARNTTESFQKAITAGVRETMEASN